MGQPVDQQSPGRMALIPGMIGAVKPPFPTWTILEIAGLVIEIKAVAYTGGRP